MAHMAMLDGQHPPGLAGLDEEARNKTRAHMTTTFKMAIGSTQQIHPRPPSQKTVPQWIRGRSVAMSMGGGGCQGEARLLTRTNEGQATYVQALRGAVCHND